MGQLDKLQASAAEYEDEESIFPSDEVFRAAREFLRLLEIKAEEKRLEEPKLSPSPNGHLVLRFGASAQILNIRFKPEVSFVMQNGRTELAKGKDADQALELAFQKFQIR